MPTDTLTTPSTAIQWTNDYSLFVNDPRNRDPNDPKNKAHLAKVQQSLKDNGWFPCPVICVKRYSKLVIQDGANRFQGAKNLGMPIMYVVIEDKVIDIAGLNSTPKAWDMADFVDTHIDNPHYKKLKDFSREFGIKEGVAAQILGGFFGDSGSGVLDSLKTGKFETKDLTFARQVAQFACDASDAWEQAKTRTCLSALAWVFLVEGFDPNQLMSRLKSSTRKIYHCTTIDMAIEMLDKLYNYRNTTRLPILFQTREIQRKRRIAYLAEKRAQAA